MDRNESKNVGSVDVPAQHAHSSPGPICSAITDILLQMRGTKVQQAKARLCNGMMQLHLKVQVKMAAGLDKHTGLISRDCTQGMLSL